MTAPRRHPGRRSLSLTVAVLAAAVGLAACSGSGSDGSSGSPAARGVDAAGSGSTSGSGTGGSTSAPSTTATSTTDPATTSSGPTSGTPASSAPSKTAGSASAHRPTSPVHISLFNADGAHYGVGMPVIAYFSRQITDAAALQRATTVTVDGRSERGAWYFEQSGAGHGPVEGHLRLQGYWPAHSTVHVDIPAKGLSAGTGLAYDDSLTLDFTTGARNVSYVNDRTHMMTVTSDGKQWARFPVSLGAADTPTLRGTKVVMEKQYDTAMRGPGYYDPDVYWTQRLTYGGEYLHAAPWNEPPYGNIGRSDSSNGCTNLTTTDAKRLYNFLEVGDVVKYPNATGPVMALGQGYGDWNLTWSQWLTGGLVSTT